MVLSTNYMVNKIFQKAKYSVVVLLEILNAASSIHGGAILFIVNIFMYCNVKTKNAFSSWFNQG